MGFVFGANDYRIYLRWDGAYYSLATGSAVTWQVGDVLRLEVTGSVDPVTLALYHNGVQVLSWLSTGSGYVRVGGSPGIGIYSPSGTGLTLGDWEGGNLAPDTQPPTAPTAPTAPASLTATAAGSSQIDLSWTASTDSVGVTRYLVEREDPGSTNFAQVGTATGTTYTNTGLAAGAIYSYRVRATNAAGNLSGYSPVASTATAPDIAVQLNGGSFVAGFTQPAGLSGVTYHMEWSTTLLPGGWTVIADTGIPPQHVFSVPTLGHSQMFMRLTVTAP
jgi:chitodextrinase